MKLLNNMQLGSLDLKNRVIMAPMTRMRSMPDGVPTDLNATYYAQRAGAGLIITEATAISKGSLGYINAPSIYNADHVDGWKKVVNAVHAEGGKVFLQMFHVGRISHHDLLGGSEPVAPSSVPARGEVHTLSGKKSYSTPRALELSEITDVITEFKIAAQHAKDAGFDGIELHAANGYLLNQFIDSTSNRRTDNYGGSKENRGRFLFEVIDAVTKVWDSNRVGIRLSPSGLLHDAGDSNPRDTYGYIIEKLNDYNLAYLHLMNPTLPIDNHPEMEPDVIGFYGKLYKGNVIMNGGFTRETGNDLVESGQADMISYGKLFISNPDLPKRFELNAGYNEFDPNSIYGGSGAEGYTDYPILE